MVYKAFNGENMIELTQFNYNESTGLCTWKKRDIKWFKSKGLMNYWNSRNSGKTLNSEFLVGKKKYSRVSLLDNFFYLHRIIWLYMTGDWPKHIDHIDGNGLNNKWVNLRDVDKSENNRNRRKFSTNTSGHNGICFHKPTKKWMARTMVNGKRKHIGLFNSLEDAVAARKLADKEYCYHKNHGQDRPL